MSERSLPEDHWARRGLFVLDTETTGIDVETALIGSISAGPLNPNGASDIRTSYIPVDMPEEASAVNGLTTAYLAEHGEPAGSVLDRYVTVTANAVRAGRALVIANAPYDLTVLDRECRRHGVRSLSDHLGTVMPVVDPIVLDKRAVKYRRRVSREQGARCLKTICQVHGCGWDDELAHTSAYDALQAGRAVYAVLAGFAALSRLSLPELHALQIDWYREQAEGLRVWFAGEAVKRKQWAEQARLDEHAQEDAARHLTEAAEFRQKAESVDTVWPFRPLVQVARS